MPTARTYFAARNRKEIGKALWERLEPLLTDGAHDNREEMRNAYSHVYGRDVGYGIPSGVTRGGDRGELALMRINTATANARARHAIISGAKLTWKAQAKDGSAASAGATSLAADVLEDQWKTKGLEGIVSMWLARAGYFSEWFVFPEWDRSTGPALAAMGGRLINQGDIVYNQVAPWDVARDNSAKDWDSCQWQFARLARNRYDLAAMYQQLPDGRQGQAAQEAILNACDSIRDDKLSRGDGERFRDSDLVSVWHFFHQPSASLPLGRHVVLVGSDLVLEDEPVKGPHATYEEVPLYRLSDEDIADSPYARAVFWDTLGAQEMADGIDTAVATRATTLSNPIIGIAAGSDVQPDVMGNGWRSWKYPINAQPPREVEFRPVQKEMLDYRKDLQSQQRSILGLNDVALGQPQSAQMNAQAFAVLASMAVQQGAPFQSKWTSAVSKLGTGVLKTLAKRVVRQRSVRGVGGLPVKYTGEKLKAIDSVHVQIGNPMEQTAAGRKTILDDKIKLGFITSAEQYDQVLATGRDDAAMKRNTAEMTLVQKEREQLLRGEMPKVDFWQNHPLHFRENSAAGLETDDEATKQNVATHLDEHYFAQFGVDRAEDPLGPLRERWLLGMASGPGQEQPMGPPGGAPQPGAPGEAPAPGAPGEPTAAPPEGQAAAAGVPGAEIQAASDVPPTTNPLTGAPFDPASGGLQ